MCDQTCPQGIILRGEKTRKRVFVRSWVRTSTKALVDWIWSQVVSILLLKSVTIYKEKIVANGIKVTELR